MEDFDIDHSENFDYIDHSIEPENSREGESVLDLPSQIIVGEEEIQVHTQAISRYPRSAWYLRFFRHIEDIIFLKIVNVVNTLSGQKYLHTLKLCHMVEICMSLKLFVLKITSIV